MDAVESRPNLRRRWILAQFGLRDASATELLAKAARHKLRVDLLPPALAKEAQAVFRHRQVTDLPSDVCGAASGNDEPLDFVDLSQSREHVRAGKLNLLEGQLKRHVRNITPSDFSGWHPS